METKKVILKSKKDKAIRNHHHWIFSGAVESLPENFSNGDFLNVFSSDQQFLGTGYFNKQSKIIGRMVTFDETDPFEQIEKKIKQAIQFRKSLFDPQLTNAYRLINAEGDGLPGLIIDVYDRVLVIQSSTLGIDNILSWLIKLLIELLNPSAIYEKSTQSVRKQEGLKEREGFLDGEENPEIEFKENGLVFRTNLAKSQKTGFFLDHREMRQLIRSHSKDKKVLNAFSYTGGFTAYALAGGALQADSVDISQEAIDGARTNIAINGLDNPNNKFYGADVFKFLREQELADYDVVILDPPAFAKKQKDIIPACRGYKDINRLAMQKMKSGSILLTSSCSHYVDLELFQKVVFQAAAEAKREARIIGFHQLAPDHPINLFHPESDYLKSLLLYIN